MRFATNQAEMEGFFNMYNSPWAIFLKWNYNSQTIKMNYHFDMIRVHNRHQKRHIVKKQSNMGDFCLSYFCTFNLKSNFSKTQRRFKRSKRLLSVERFQFKLFIFWQTMALPNDLKNFVAAKQILLGVFKLWLSDHWQLIKLRPRVRIQSLVDLKKRYNYVNCDDDL